jgi:site-specific DNA recombinase
MSKKAVIYTRVSTEEQSENYSLPTQLEGCKLYAERNDFEVVGEFADSYTGTSLDRPKLNEVKKLAGSVDAVIVYTQDRFGRAEALDTWNLVADFDSKGTQVHTADRGLVNIHDFLGQLEMLFRARAAQEESQKIGERTKRGKKARAKAGKVIISHVSPYGYEYDSNTGMLVIIEEQAHIVRLIFQWYVYGDEDGNRLGIRGIVRKLSDMRVPTKYDADGYRRVNKQQGVWAISSVTKILEQETYAGRWYYNRSQSRSDSRTKRLWKDKSEWIAVEVPSIVSRDLWELAQIQRTRNSFTSSRNTKYEYLLRGYIYCGHCGTSFRCRTDYRNSQGDWTYYVCLGQDSLSSHDGHTIRCGWGLRRDSVDDSVWNTIADMLKNPDVVSIAMQQKQTEMEAQLQPDQDFLERCEQLVAKLKTRRERLLKLYLDGHYDKEWLDEELAKIEKEDKELRAKINDLRQRITQVEIGQAQIEHIHKFCESARNGLDHFTFEGKRMILEALDIKAFVHRGKTKDEDIIILTGYIPTVVVASKNEVEFASISPA